jgi:PAS domain S-box-containing protein
MTASAELKHPPPSSPEGAQTRTFAALPASARLYVQAVTLAGAVVFLLRLPNHLEAPTSFFLLFAAAVCAATLKVTLPLTRSGATMALTYVVDFLSLILIGPRETMLISVMAAWVQCHVRAARSTPLFRVMFSLSVIVLTIQASGLAYDALGGRARDLDAIALARPLVGAAMTYFVVNSVLVAIAIALSTRQPIAGFWRDSFQWSAPSYLVGAGVAAVAAKIVESQAFWMVPLIAAPVYVTYRTYTVYLGRIEDNRRHVAELSQAHEQAVDALAHARRSEQALAAEKEQLRVTLMSIGDGVITTDVGGVIALMNEGAEKFTGWSQEEAVGRPLADVFRAVDRDTRQPLADPVAQVLRTRESIVRDGVALVSRDGTERLIEDTSAPIRDDDGAVIGAVLGFRDMTDAIHLQEERLKASKLASLGVLAGGIAHDFNNILTAILGNIALARMDEHLEEETATILAEAETACQRAKGLTRQLLTFSKGGAPVKTTLKLETILRDTVTFALRGSNVKCEFMMARDLAVQADEGQISQVIGNLVINAQQAMPEGGVLIVRAANVAAHQLPRMHTPTTDRGRYVEFSIEDRGVGIPEANLSKIFDPYFTTKPHGNGLGLATSYSIVRHHGGSMSVRSRLGEGTTVHVYLPAAPDGLPAAPEATSMTQRTQATKGRILLMDDEDIVSSLGQRMLKRLGYDVQIAREGGEAIQMYQEARETGTPFDAVIMDLTIPGGMGGKEAIVQLRELDPDIRAIVSSGYADDPVMAEFSQYGFAGVMPKPFTPDELRKSLTGVLDAQDLTPQLTC